MLKKSFVILVMSLMGFSTMATAGINNPLFRICANNSGVFQVMYLSGSPSNLNAPYKDVALCQFGSTLIDSLSLINYRDQNTQSMALSAFLNDETSCQKTGGEVIEKNLGPACLYSDASVIDLQSLEQGASQLPSVKNTIENLN